MDFLVYFGNLKYLGDFLKTFRRQKVTNFRSHREALGEGEGEKDDDEALLFDQVVRQAIIIIVVGQGLQNN